MDKRIPSVSVKHFDYKLPLIRNTSGFSYSSNSTVKIKAMYKYLPKDRQSVPCESLTITGLNETMKEFNHVKPHNKSKSSVFILRRVSNIKKLVPVAAKGFDFLDEEVKGWEYSKRSN
jgi:hypothetical protein